jgi:hypothetical protein
VTHYRLFFQGPNGHLLRAQDVYVDTDEEAFERAREYNYAHPIEVWRCGRRAAMIRPERSGVRRQR